MILNKTRCRVLRAATGVLMVAALVSGKAMAQSFPNRPIKVVVGYVPGGGPDFVARTFGQRLGDLLGQPVVIENRPGAGGTTATAFVAKQPADGYTLLLGETGQLVIAPYIFKNLGYDTLKDFTPLSLVGTGALVLVANARSGMKRTEDLIREAKARPGKLDYGSSGIGSIHHIAMEVFKADAGVQLEHVPFKGSGQSVTSVLAGEVPVILTSITAAGAHIQAGKLNLLAVTSAARMPSHPDVPSIGEVVDGFDYSSEMGFLAPANLPADLVARYSAVLRQAANSAEVQEAFRKTTTLLGYTTPEQYAENLRRNLRKYERAVRLAKIPMN